MKKMSLTTGRVKQKEQTRRKILETTKEILQKGEKITLEDIAIFSGVSRATIYRYFSNIDILCSEASLDISTQSNETIFEQTQHLPIIERILAIQKYFNELAINNEVAFRRYLSIYLKETDITKKPTRGARRIIALKLALSPYKKDLDKKTYENLINTATTLMGIESIITTKDVCKLSNTKAQDTLAWGLRIILKSIFEK